ncbi:MAG: hypothetical protein ACLTOV_10700 [Phocaeicola sp.]
MGAHYRKCNQHYGKLSPHLWENGTSGAGALGAGISALLSRIFMLLLFVLIFIKQEKYKPFRQGFLVTPFRKAYWKRLNLIGWPIAFQQGIEAATFLHHYHHDRLAGRAWNRLPIR